MLERLIDRLTIAQALAHCRGREDDVTGVQSSLPVFTSAGSRVGDPWMLRLDWSQMPEDYLWSPGITRILQRTADSLPPRHRAALLVDTEGVAAADVATGSGSRPRRCGAVFTRSGWWFASV